MRESDEFASGFPDTLGIVGLAFAILGMAVSESAAMERVSCLVLSAICLTLSFTGQARWPGWVRLVLSLAANIILISSAWLVFSGR